MMKSQILTKPQTITSRQIAGDEFLTTEELMRLLKIGHKQTIYRLIKQGLPAILVGKNYRFMKSEILNFLKENSRSRLKQQVEKR